MGSVAVVTPCQLFSVATLLPLPTTDAGIRAKGCGERIGAKRVGLLMCRTGITGPSRWRVANTTTRDRRQAPNNAEAVKGWRRARARHAAGKSRRLSRRTTPSTAPRAGVILRTIGAALVPLHRDAGGLPNPTVHNGVRSVLHGLTADDVVAPLLRRRYRRAARPQGYGAP